MKQATINFKTDEETKQQAQELAKLLGIPLGTLLHAYLREFVVSQEVHFSHVQYRSQRSMPQLVTGLNGAQKAELRHLLNKDNAKRAFGNFQADLSLEEEVV